MHEYVQSLSCRKIFAVAILIGAVVFLFMYSDNTLNSYYYDDEFLELVNLTHNSTVPNPKNHHDVNIEQNVSSNSWTHYLITSTSSISNNLNITEGDILEESTDTNQNHIELSTKVFLSTPFSSSTLSKRHAVRTKEDITQGPLTTKFVPSKNDYLVWSPECKIPNFNPFNKQAMKYFHKEKYISCSKHRLLSFVNISDNKATLYIDKKVLPFYTKNPISCCYSNVTRHGSNEKPDDGIKFSTCTPFNSSVKLSHSTVKISCRKNNKNTFYENIHEVITEKEQFFNLKFPRNASRPPSLLIVGIDSISRLNLVRAMPKTYDYLSNRSDTWFPLYGYNKIGENTFPNLIAIFTGYNDTEAYRICNPKKIGPLDSCRFIWKDYKKFGYITAYAEDETWINTFNYRKKGFTKEPVDYYFRPYMQAAESIGTVKQDTLSYCAGPESSGERIMNLAKNFANTYKNYANFGFFWMNTFSHNNLNTPSRMDEKVTNLLKEITDRGILENSIVIFLSDHGMRFGEIRHTFTGWLEERLPYIFFSFPTWFKEKYPQEITNFQINANRLTTPYDVHLTLQHILVLSGFNYSLRTLDTCPLCKSLFTTIGLNRSCEKTGITPHWCTCGGYSKLDQKEQTVVKAAYFLIGEVQKLVFKKGGNLKCAKFHLGKILTSYISDKFSYKNDTYLLIAVETVPKAVFESTLHFKTDAKNNMIFSIESSISRLDSYAQHGKCVTDETLKQYCFCK
ncbi:hypothetical protein HHI36_008919 [Cryptolaemus montrouzieri]|uniref:DUF229 domain containing protein n=1 Tax=Cryptolaemus montrouzieri TaxID=559131 RepID=A0ABD2MUE3_9CUCU